VSQHEFQELIRFGRLLRIDLAIFLGVGRKFLAGRERSGGCTGASSVDQIEDVDMLAFEKLEYDQSELEFYPSPNMVVLPFCIAW